ncbi:MAG: Conjugation TrbI family [Desulfovibrionaceae bacterium]|nr:MAG: Conjugation TrbI family [Desulfovibrionaceae bacterium]
MVKAPEKEKPEDVLQVERMAKWPLYALLAVGLAVAVFMLFMMDSADSKKKKEQAPRQTVNTTETKAPLLQAPQGSLMQPPPQPSAAAKKEEPKLVTVVTNPTPLDNKRELDELQKRKHQQAMNALSSPLLLKRGNEKPEKSGEKDAAQVASTPILAREVGQPQAPRELNLESMMPTREGAYDPAADKDKEGFFNRAKTDGRWVSQETRVPGYKYEVKTGWVIPAVMVGGINSDLPGRITAQVSQNVFDTATGENLLIPQGSKLHGSYDSRIVYGQSRLLVAWNRIVFPDGSSVTLETMPGTDSAGYAGFSDDVDNHYFRLFGSAILMSLIAGGTSWAVDTVTPASTASLGSNNSPSLQQQMASSLATQLGQTTSQMLSKNMNIKPTLEIRPGYRFNVTVTKDLVFRGPYAN